MTDEHKLSIAAAKAARAQELLGNELLAEAFKGLRDQYSADLLATTQDQAGARERLYLAHRIVGEVERHLSLIIVNGTLATRELRDLAEAAERKKNWPDVRG